MTTADVSAPTLPTAPDAELRDALVAQLGGLHPLQQLAAVWAFTADLKNTVLDNLRRRFVELLPAATRLTWDWENQHGDEGQVWSNLEWIKVERAGHPDTGIVLCDNMQDDSWHEAFMSAQDLEAIEAMQDRGDDDDVIEAAILEAVGKAFGLSGPEYVEASTLATLLASDEIELAQMALVPPPVAPEPV